MKELEKVVLDNGLTIYLLNDNTKHTTIANLIVNFGGLDTEVVVDNKKYSVTNGMAHFLEHVVLESTVFGDLMENFGKKGIGSNGLTSINCTRFYIDTVEKFDENLELLIKGIHSPIFDEKIIEDIRKPILEEKRISLDNKFSNLYNANLSTLLNNKKFKSILGDIKDVERISVKDLKKCFETFYRPSNEIIVIIGKFDRENILALIQKTYNSISFRENKVDKVIKPYNMMVNKKKCIVKCNTNIGRTVVTFKLDTMNLSGYEKVMLDVYLFSFLKMNFGVMSNLNKRLLNEGIIVGNMAFSCSILEGYHVVRIEANTNNSKEFTDIVAKFILNKEYKFYEDLFELYKKGFIIDLITRNDNLYSILEPLIENIVTFGYESLDKIESLEEINLKTLIEKVESLDFSNYSITELKPL